MTPRLRASITHLGVLFILTNELLVAGGPRVVSAGRPFKWDFSKPLAYRIDGGGMMALSESDSLQMVRQAFDQWITVATASISVVQQPLNEDVLTAARYKALIANAQNGSLVILDNDGSIVADLFGEENRRRILGGTRALRSRTSLVRFYALLNGAHSGDRLKMSSVAVHEAGHALGLDHAQINSQFARNGIASDDDRLPSMFPTSTDDPKHLMTLNPDDVSWISWMYAKAGSATQFGQLTGRVTKHDGSPVLGANVVAIRVTSAASASPPTTSAHDRFSCVSDYLKGGNGEFTLSLPPGRYVLRLEPIRADFFGPSSVGPYAETAVDVSFTTAVRAINLPTVYDVIGGNHQNIGILTAQ